MDLADDRRPQQVSPDVVSAFLTDGVAIGPKGTSEIATYTSLTEWRGERILWYPDRKYFLLGKRITDDWLSSMIVPKPSQ